MKKEITVRKNIKYRIGMYILFVCIVLFSLFCSVKIDRYVMLSLLPEVVILFISLMYYETWKICLLPDRICKNIFFLTLGNYSYFDIKNITQNYSYTEGKYIRIIFQNGKSFRFRLEDENADKAIKRILSYHTIQILD